MELIETYTVPSATTQASIVFTDIPETFTDLKILFSLRNATSPNTTGKIKFNNSTSSYAGKTIYANASGYDTVNSTGGMFFAMSVPAYTANTFGNGMAYITNYASSNYKTIIGESTSETNDTVSYINISGSTWSVTDAITIVSLVCDAGAFDALTTVSLYGIKAESDGTTTIS
jgi:hypothetical protein